MPRIGGILSSGTGLGGTARQIGRRDLLPRELTRELEKLHDELPPFAFEEVPPGGAGAGSGR